MIIKIEATSGGTRRLHRKINNMADFHFLIKEGFPFEVGNFLKESLQLSNKDFAKILGVSGRTLCRIRQKGKRLPHFASDRLFRLARIYSIAKRVLGDEHGASEWLQRAQWGLGGRVPLDLLETDPGTDEVKNILGRIELGILA